MEFCHPVSFTGPPQSRTRTGETSICVLRSAVRMPKRHPSLQRTNTTSTKYNKMYTNFTTPTSIIHCSEFARTSISLNFSKASDRAHWTALWTALFEQGVFQHLISGFTTSTTDNMVGDFGRSDQILFTSGVRQGPVLSPRLFCPVLKIAMREWMHAVGEAGIDLMDGGPIFILFFLASRMPS